MAKFNYNPFTGNLDQMPSQATQTAQGTVTSYAPLVQVRYNSVSSANYVILDNDGFEQILVTTGNSDRTITLPTGADNDGRLLTINKVDTGTGAVIIDGENSETINGYTTVTMYNQFNTITVLCDGANWQVVSATLDTKWILFTPSWSANTPTWTTNKGSWRRIGDSMEIMVDNVASGTGGVGALTMTIPLSKTIDEAKQPNGSSSSVAASCGVLGAGAVNFGAAFRALSVAAASSTAIGFVEVSSVSSVAFVAGTEVTSGDVINLHFTVPISEFAGIF